MIKEPRELRVSKYPNRPFGLPGIEPITGISLVTLAGAGFAYFFGKDALTWAAGMVLDTLAALLATLAVFMSKLTYWASSFTSPFIAAGNNVTRMSQVQALWIVTRDIANLLLIIILLIAAVLVIIRHQQGNYTIKQVLPKVALSVLLINFSKLIIQVIIDFFHVVTVGIYDLLKVKVPESNYKVKSFPDAALGEGVAVNEQNAPVAIINRLASNYYVSSSTAKGKTVNVEFVMAMMLTLIIVFTILVAAVSILILYITRFIALAMLTALSPIAMIAGVLPFTQQYAATFWKMLIKNAAVGAILAAHFSFGFAMLEIFDNIGDDYVTAINNAPKLEGSAPGSTPSAVFATFADVEWGALLEIIFIYLIIKNAVKVAKSTSFADGLITSTEGAMNRFGRKWGVDKPVGMAKSAARGVYNTGKRGVKGAARGSWTLAKKVPIIPTGQRADGDGALKLFGGKMRSIDDISGGLSKAKQKWSSNRASAQDIRSTEYAESVAGAARKVVPTRVVRNLAGVGDNDEREIAIELDRKRYSEMESGIGDIGIAQLRDRIRALATGGIHDADQALEATVLASKIKDHAKQMDHADAARVKSMVGQAHNFYNDSQDDLGRKYQERLFKSMNDASMENTRFASDSDMAEKQLKVEGRGTGASVVDAQAAVAPSLSPQAIANLDNKLLEEYIEKGMLDQENLSRIAADPKITDMVHGGASKRKIIEKAIERGYVQLVSGTESAGDRDDGADAAMDYFTEDSRRIQEHQNTHGVKGVGMGSFMRNEDSQTLSTDFNSPEMRAAVPGAEDMAAFYVTEAEDKKRLIDALEARYREQLQGELQDYADNKLSGARKENAPKTGADVDRMVSEFRAVAERKKGIRVLNKSRKGRNAIHLVQHEGYHDGLQQLSSADIRGYWDEYNKDYDQRVEKYLAQLQSQMDKFNAGELVGDEAERAPKSAEDIKRMISENMPSARELVERQYGGALNEMQVAQEFFAESLANTEKHAEENGFKIHNQEIIDKIKAAISEKRKGSSSGAGTGTSPSEPKTPPSN